jgi:hypothetical protein
MPMPHILLFLHITFFIAGITISYGPLLLLRLAYRTGEVGNIRGLAVVHSRLGPLTFLMYMLGGIFGGLTAIAFGFDLLAPWLVIAYVAFGIAVLTGVTENRTWPLRLAEAVKRTPDGPLTPEIQDLFMNRRTLSVLAIDIAWFFVIIFDMVIKPFSSSSRSSVAPTQWFPVGNESHRHQGSSASSDGAARPKARSVRPPIQSATSWTYICGASNGSR